MGTATAITIERLMFLWSISADLMQKTITISCAKCTIHVARGATIPSLSGEPRKEESKVSMVLEPSFWARRWRPTRLKLHICVHRQVTALWYAPVSNFRHKPAATYRQSFERKAIAKSTSQLPSFVWLGLLAYPSSRKMTSTPTSDF